MRLHVRAIRPIRTIRRFQTIRTVLPYGAALAPRRKRSAMAPMRKARKRLTASQRLEIFEKTGGRCAYCGIELTLDHMQVDHMVSLHNHGNDDMGNLVSSCRECNYYKGGCNPDGFRKKLKKAFRQEKKRPFVQMLEDRYEGWNGVFHFERMDEAIF